MTEIKANFHTHSTCSDGKDSPEAIVLQALEQGMTILGFSDHIDPYERTNIKDFPAYLRELHRLREVYGDRIELLIGAELDSLMPLSAAEGAEYIIGSTHYFDLPAEKPIPVDRSPEIIRNCAEEYFNGDIYRLTRHYFHLEAEIVEKTHPNIIGHFDLISLHLEAQRNFDANDPRYTGPALEAMEHLVSRGIPFEINCGAVNRGSKTEYYPGMFLLRSLKRLGGEIIINSDAHRREWLTRGFAGAVEAAKACGFDHVNVLTKEGTGKLHRKEIGLL